MISVTDTKKPLQKMFNRVPKRYDLMNRLLTLRFDELWRRRAAEECLKNSPEKIIDIGTGTGDLAIHIAGMANSNTSILGYDFSNPMLETAKAKAEKHSHGNISFISGDIGNMPFPNDHFDVITTAFAFRNITFKNPNTDRYLSEILRTLKKDGKFVIVETCQPESYILRKLFHLYLKYIVSGLGGAISGHRSAYHYLAYSATNYYNKDEINNILKKAGFIKVEYKLLLAGIAAIYTCKK